MRPRPDALDYIEMFYSPKCKHVGDGILSPVEFERRQKVRPVCLQNWRLFRECGRAVPNTIGI